MNTGTPASNPGTRRNALRQGPRAPGGRNHAKLMSTGRPAGPHTATGLIGSRPAVWLAMAAMLAIIIALAMFQGALPVGAAPNTVSNTGQTTSTSTTALGTGTSDVSKIAQAFTTGNNKPGYAVTDARIKLAGLSSVSDAGTDLELTLYNDSGGDPGTLQCTFTDPGTFTANATNTFAAPTDDDACPELEDATTYYLVLERVSTTSSSTIDVALTASDSEDTSTTSGWTVGDASHSYVSSWSSAAANNYQIQVNAEEVENNEASGPALVTGKARSGNTLGVDTDLISDGDGLGTFSYQWSYIDSENETDISGATASTYPLTDDDVGKTLIVKISFLDGNGVAEEVKSAQSQKIVGTDFISGSTQNASRGTLSLTSATPRLAQPLTSSATAGTYRLDHVSVWFRDIANTGTAGDEITVTINEDSSGTPGDSLCTLSNPDSFSSSGGLHKFTAPTATIGTSCPKLEPSNTYYVVVQRANTNPGNIRLHILGSVSGTHSGNADGWDLVAKTQNYTDATSTWAELSSDNQIGSRSHSTPRLRARRAHRDRGPVRLVPHPRGCSRRPEVPSHVPDLRRESHLHGHQRLQRVRPGPGRRRTRRHPGTRQPVPGAGQHGECGRY